VIYWVGEVQDLGLNQQILVLLTNPLVLRLLLLHSTPNRRNIHQMKYRRQFSSMELALILAPHKEMRMGTPSKSVVRYLSKLYYSLLDYLNHPFEFS
jgi:hypothetical protein